MTAVGAVLARPSPRMPPRTIVRLDHQWIEEHLASLPAAMPTGESREMHATGCQELVDAISRIPVDIKEAFEEALTNCPSLVQLESDPVRFLRREGFNGWAAALRLMEYWTTRKRVFAAKAFLPLTLTNGGALEEEDVAFLNSGALAILPEETHGRPVALSDRAAAARFNNVGKNSIVRASFYVHQKLSEREASRKDGIVVIDVLSRRTDSEFSGSLLCVDELHKAFPSKLCSIHVTLNVDDTSKDDFLQSLLPAFLVSAGSVFRSLVVPVPGASRAEVLLQFKRHGFVESGLPNSLGGSWVPSNGLNVMKGRKISAGRQKRGRYESNDLQGASALVELAHRSTNSGVPNVDLAGALSQLHDALALLPDYEKSAWVEATKVAPELVERESPPSLFLLCERRDPWAAAKRIATYWTKRKSIFAEKAFLPLNLSGRGALSDDDILAFKSCYMVQLPDTATGQSVICFNRALEPRGLSVESQWRALFYLAHVCSRNEASVRDGVVSLHILTQQLSSAPPPVMMGALDLWKSALPHRVDTCHFICIKSKNNLTSSILNWFQIAQRNSQHYNDGSVFAHVVDSGFDVVAKLGPFGVLSSGIPVSIGGSWSYSNGVRWVEQHSHSTSALNGDVTGNLEVEVADTGPREKKMKADAPRSSFPDAQDLSTTRSGGVRETPSDDEAFTAEFVESASVTANGLDQMEQALADLPDDEKAELQVARREAPALVEKESPMLRFLRFEKYNSWAAARRLALYWKNRRRVFGDRYLMPLNQTGEGALTKDDIASLNTGYVAFLKYDSRGRSVLLYDSSRRVNHSPETRLRCSFYIWSILAENSKSQEEGYISLSVLSRPTLDRTMKECIALVEESIPARACGSHIVNCPSLSGHSSFTNTMVPLMLQIMGPFLEEKVRVHVAESRLELAEKLAACGFDKASLPKCVGGDWGYEMYSQWQENRIRYEWDLPAGSGAENQPHIPVKTLKPLSEMTDEEKVERKRRMNVLHSRRRRERERVEMEVFSEQVTDLREKNWILKQENDKLETMLHEARAEVMRLGSFAPTTTKSRQDSPCSSPSAVSRNIPLAATSEFLRDSSPTYGGLAVSASRTQGQHPTARVKPDHNEYHPPQHFVDESCRRGMLPVNEAALLASPTAFETSLLQQRMLPAFYDPRLLNQEQTQQRTIASRMLQLERLLDAQRDAQAGPRRTAEEFLHEQYALQRRERVMMNRDEPHGLLAGLLGIPSWFS